MKESYNAAVWLADRNIETGNGQRRAIVGESGEFSYEDVLKQVFRVQNALRELNVGREERVALVLSDEPAFPAWFLGCMRSGVVPVPLSTMLTGYELGAIVEDCLAKVIVVSKMFAHLVPEILRRAALVKSVIITGDDAAEDVSILAGPGHETVHGWEEFVDGSESLVASTTQDSPGFWLYSSGTTGLPKGVMHRHFNLEVTANTYAKAVLKATEDDVFYSAAKLFFAFGLGNSLTFPFAVGASVVLHPQRATPKGIGETVAKFAPSLFFGSPGLLAAIVDNEVPVKAFSSVRLGVTAGEALPREVLKLFSSRYGFEVLDGIGSTEALHIFLSNAEGEVRPGTSGRPVPGYRMKLLDENENLISEPDIPGYLYVAGDSIATGYWARTDASRKAFCGEWLKTGDVYVRSEDGYFKFLGRNNDMIKMGGIWVSPAEVEGVLVEHPDVLEAAVVGSRNQDGLETTVAFIVVKTGKLVEEASIEAHCRAKMAAYKRPRSIVFVDELPKTATGKVQRFQLRDKLLNDAVHAKE